MNALTGRFYGYGYSVVSLFAAKRSIDSHAGLEAFIHHMKAFFDLEINELFE
jgi:hypothetical protein